VTDLDDLIAYIHRLSVPVPYIPLTDPTWRMIRDEVIERCKEEGEEFSAHATFPCPNFLLYGIPIVLGGTA
jgi:hypothetical protein